MTRPPLIGSDGVLIGAVLGVVVVIVVALVVLGVWGGAS